MLGFSLLDIGPGEAKAGHLRFCLLAKIDSGPSLSPTGKYLGALVNAKDKQLLLIRDLDDLAKKPYLISGQDWKIQQHLWVSPNEQPCRRRWATLVVSRLIHVDVKKQKQRLLFKRKKSAGFFQMQDRVLARLRDKPGPF